MLESLVVRLAGLVAIVLIAACWTLTESVLVTVLVAVPALLASLSIVAVYERHRSARADGEGSGQL